MPQAQVLGLIFGKMQERKNNPDLWSGPSILDSVRIARIIVTKQAGFFESGLILKEQVWRPVEMRCAGVWFLCGVIFVFSGCSALTEHGGKVECGIWPANLRCEYRLDPLGIDAQRPRLSWIIESSGRGQIQRAYQVIVASSEGNLKAGKGDLWDSGKVGSRETVNIIYDGSALDSFQRCWWKVRVWDREEKVSRWSQGAWWETAFVGAEKYKGIWVNDGKRAPRRDEDFYKDSPAPMFRKEFDIGGQVKCARLYISGLGYYQASLNGEKVGDDLLSPGWTTYSKRVLYNTYDVTKQLSRGRNCIGVMLGNGWYNPLPMKMWGRINVREHLTIGMPRLFAQLEIEYEDSNKESVITDESWRVADGPILRNNVYLGEVYDARKEAAGWDEVGFDDSGWKYAKAAVEPLGGLCAESQPAVKAVMSLRPVEMTEPKAGVFIFDMGQNIVGMVRLRVKGRAGTEVKLRYGELLYPDGTLNAMTSVCGQIKKAGVGGPGAPEVAYQSDRYILKGGGPEVYVPRFTYHGFRYVEVTGYPGQLTLDSIEGVVVASAAENVGSFECSDEMFNRIHKMVWWSCLGNIRSVQSDCPHREKFGYGNEALHTSEALMFNFDMAGLYEKIVRDFADAVRPNGGLTETAPYVGIADRGLGGGSGPIGWGITHPYLQQQLYRYYGNDRIIKEQYEITKRWVEFLAGNAKGHIITKCLGDWQAIERKSIPLTATAYYYSSAAMLARFAKIVGNDADAREYEALAGRIKEAFIHKFLKPGTGQFESHTQACQSFALFYDLVPEAERQVAVDVLTEQVIDHDKGHVAAGFTGTRMMLDVLSESGRADIAYTVVNQKTYPGWGYMLECGATTVWEHWGFSDNVYSHNHASFGSVDAWFYKVLGGIYPDTEAVGFDKIVIKPRILGDLTWVKASYNSIRGRIATNWQLKGDTLELDVIIPANTTATIYVPAASIGEVRESGKTATGAEGLRFLGSEGGSVVFAAGGGEYHFVSKIRR